MGKTLGKPALKHKPEPITLQRERMRLTVWGEFGAGKTTLALTAPRPLVIDTNGGLISVAVEATGSPGDAWTPEDHVDLEALGFWLLENRDNYDTIAIDSGDSLIKMLMDEIVQDAAKRHDDDDLLRMSFVPEQGDYLASQRQIDRFLTFLRRINKHTIVTFSARDFEKTGRRGPNVSPGMLQIFMDWSSVVGELVVVTSGAEAGQRALVCAPPGGRRLVKTRFKCFTDPIVNPTFDGMWDSVVELYEQNTQAPKGGN